MNKSKTFFMKAAPLGEQAESALHHSTLQSHAKLYSKFVNMNRGQPNYQEPIAHTKQRSMPALLTDQKMEEAESIQQYNTGNDF